MIVDKLELLADKIDLHRFKNQLVQQGWGNLPEIGVLNRTVLYARMDIMGRPKKFNREEVLTKALPVFWSRGFADTALQDLEKATGVNKSGLYSEFKDKEDIFVESLRHYYSTRVSRDFLNKEPLGWSNIEDFMTYLSQRSVGEQKGCFGVNCLRELEVLPEQARELIMEQRQSLRQLFLKNVQAAHPKAPPEMVTELVMTYFSGLCIEQNLKTAKAECVQKVQDFVQTLRSM